jgi:hypothetical protein
VSYSAGIPFEERNRLMDHVLDVDQHVRYALVLQATLGTALAALYGYFPGGSRFALGAAFGGLAWLLLVELTHRWRRRPSGAALATFDRGLRYAIMAVLAGIAVTAALGRSGLPLWLWVKLGCFAAVIFCGLGIRFALISFYRTWGEISRDGSTPAREQQVRTIYVQATCILVLLWVFLATIVGLSLLKPGA